MLKLAKPKESEKATEIYLRKEITKLGGLCWKWVSPSIRGVPDRICLLPGKKIFFAECKSEGRTFSPGQLRRAEDLRLRGFNVYCVDTKAAVDRMLKEETS